MTITAEALRQLPINHLLVSGGDTRLALSRVDGLNKYGCQPFPRPEEFTFASTTASTISARAYACAEQARQKLLDAARAMPLEETFDIRLEQMRSELKTLFGITDKNVNVVFSPSGTDAQLQALFVAQAVLGSPLASVVVAANETGSGTAFTAKGQHFSTGTSRGVAVEKGAPITGMGEATTSIEISVRDEKGAMRPAETMDRLVTEAVAKSVGGGKKILLQIMDGSKFGARSPSLTCVREISARWPNDVQIVVDACQARLGHERIKQYLDDGYMVLLTGSKFFTGPPFCGALLVPARLSEKLATLDKVPAGLGDYTCRSDWPLQWAGIRAHLSTEMNVGQWLRWEASLEEMRAYFAVPLRSRTAILQKFAAAVSRLFENLPALELLPDQEPSDEHAVRTVFPFVISLAGKMLSPEACTKIYYALNHDVSNLLPSEAPDSARELMAALCHIGQPVTLPNGKGGVTAALRVSADARLVSEATEENFQHRLARIEITFKKLYLLLAYFEEIYISEGAIKNPLYTPTGEGIYLSRIGIAILSKMAFDGANLKPVWNGVMKEALHDPLNSAALMDLSVLAQLMGNQKQGLALQDEALKIGCVYHSPCAVEKPRMRVLALAAALDIGSNTPIEFLLEDSDIALTTLYIVPGMPLPNPLPEHDVAFVAAQSGLAEIDRLVANWPYPVLNQPRGISKLNRDQFHELLQGVPGLYIPSTLRVSRAEIKADYPFIIRPFGSQAGRGLAKMETPADISAYLAKQPEDDFFISKFIDYSSADGLFRKYRIAFVDGKPYAVHMAISEQWAIWYLNANMAENAVKRAEEAHFMEKFDTGFAARHRAALAELAKRVGLEYFLIDCAETKTGELLIFEGGNTMIVHNMDPAPIFPYKPPQMRKVFAAFINMVKNK